MTTTCAMASSRACQLARACSTSRRFSNELVRVGETRDRFVLAMEMDLDSGGPEEEDEAVRECARYMADWYSRAVKRQRRGISR